MERFGRFAEQTTPAFTDLKVGGAGDQPGVHAAARRSPNSSTTFFKSLGKTAKLSGPALAALQPLLAACKRSGTAAKPFACSLVRTAHEPARHRRPRAPDGLHLPRRRLANGYDALGHFLRTEGVATLCLTYVITPAAGCDGNCSTRRQPVTTASSADGHGRERAVADAQRARRAS